MLLRFGIPSLDDLIDVSARVADRSKLVAGQTVCDIDQKSSDEPFTESIAILGSEGTGKSVIALHLVSSYAADCLRERAKKAIAAPDENMDPPRILYISSDLKKASAEKIWNTFKLCLPNTRHIPFERTKNSLERSQSNTSLKLRLTDLSPFRSAEIVRFLTEPILSSTGDLLEIGFLDLASHTAGDDWTFVNALLVKLQSIPSMILDSEARPLPHLVVIDSVAGFETFVGTVDAYGNEQTRRSRIAQCIRNAGDRVNLLFVVEEAHGAGHLPEEYVTDIVFSMNKRTVAASSVLTVEIQKARSRDHAKGEHPFEIRGSKGTSTGNRDNADTPAAGNAYVEVFHSLATRNRVMSASRERSNVERNNTVATFGLQYLNDLLYKGEGSKRYGLKAGTVTALIGDPSTGKSALGERFLAWGLAQMAKDFVSLYALKVEFQANKEINPVRNAFARIATALEESLIQLNPSPPQKDAMEDEIGPHIPASGWTEAALSLEQCISDGIDRTKQDLAEVIDKDYNGDSDLQDWKKLVEANTETERIACPGKGRVIWSGFPKGLLGNQGAQNCLIELFRHPNLRRPGVLLTTTDRRGADFAESCFRQLLPEIKIAVSKTTLAWESHFGEIKRQLTEIIEEQLIVRRFDMHGAPAPAIFHVIYRNLVEANRLIFGIASPHSRDRRHFKCDRIRLVIDDLRVLTKVSPEIAEDGGFLSFLTLFLEREGIVSLILHTDRMLPYRVAEDETSQSLLSVLKRAILTWNVPFEGRHRIAISVMPHNEPDKHGLVRELTIDKGGIPNVTRKLELYAGIEEGKPTQIPLAVYIFNETPQCGTYIEVEDKMFREVFKSAEEPSPIHPGRVVFPIDANRLMALRDFTHLPTGSQVAHTAVFPVDEYWAQSEPHVLDNLHAYLRAKFRVSMESQRNEDPFRLFAGEPRPGRPIDSEKSPSKRPYSREDFFINSHYELRDYSETINNGSEANQSIKKECRVPFMWDFGFLLVRSGPWEAARDMVIRAHVRQADICKVTPEDFTITSIIPVNESDSNSQRVHDVWRALVGTVEETGELKDCASFEGTSWRKFLGACSAVASAYYKQTGATVAPFDISSPSSETINALVLEILRSEMLVESRIMLGKQRADSLETKLNPNRLKGCRLSLPQLLKLTLSELDLMPSKAVHPKKIKRCFENFKEEWRQNPPATEEERVERFRNLPLGAFCFYKTWLLLLETLQFEEFLEPSDSFAFRQGRAISPQAIASRQWYKTASTLSSELNNSTSIRDAFTAFSLPGHYSTRGDWFLATSKSSRSKLLAHNAIDLLSSRRANITRLQVGLGLPVRDIVPEDSCSLLRTALRCKLVRPKAETEIQVSPFLTEINYGELCRLGAEGREDFHWQFRSEIEDYDRLSRPLQKWLGRLFRWTVDYKKSRTLGWTGGFKAYDELTCKQFGTVSEFDSFIDFGGMCDLLVDELETAQRQKDDSQ